MDKNIGRKLDGRYEITELIGIGGMADVYKATDIIDNKVVAVKILKKEFAENEEFLRRFRNESKAIALLSHPNIVKVYDVGFSEKIQFIVMEYIDGITLKEYIENEKVLTWKDSVHFVIQILRALQHAHDRGIVHRDIKPQNIMLFTDGTIKVMDFGIAKFAREEGRTATDQAIGTVHYISPEQARGDVTDEKSDIYSVGVMLYEMLTGQKPFDTDNPVTVAVMHMQNTAERPRAINPDIPAGLEEIILRAMEKDAENRYQTASDMIRDIESFKANTQIVFGYYEEDVPAEGDTPTQYFAAPAEDDESYAEEEEDYYIDEDEEDDDEYYDEEEEEEEEESRSLFIPVMTAVTIAFIVVAVIFVLWLVKGVINNEIKQTKYEMPNLVGWDYYEAKAGYEYLDIQINDTSYTSYEKDVIYEQDIAEGDAVVSGQTVYVNVSLGVSMVEVPKVSGMQRDYAVKVLEQQHFKAEIKYEMSTDGTESNYVIRTEPPAGEQAESGSTIVVYVSRGMNSDSIVLQDMTGWTLDQATQLCTYYGLKVEPEGVPSLEEENTIIDQSIKPDEVVESGATIKLTYSNGEDPSGTVPFTMQIPTDAKGTFSVDFVNSKGEVIASSRFLPSVSSHITVQVDGTGTDTITVVLTNNASYQQREIGVYNFDFANVTFRPVRENIQAAFEAVGAFPEETTTTEATTTTAAATTTVPQTQPTTTTTSATQPPATEPPTTEPPTTEPPATEPPTTEPPTTEPPATEPPAPTEASSEEAVG